MKCFVEYLSRINCVSVIVEDAKEVEVVGFKNLELEIQYREINTNSLEKSNIIMPNGLKIIDKNAQFSSDSRFKTFRLRLSVEKSTVRSAKFEPFEREKWSKFELKRLQSFTLNCAQCHSPIISRQNCSRLNDMPSEYWKELMDYWHCHKPTKEGTQENIYSNMYNSLQPATNEILIGGSYFLSTFETLKDIVITKNSDIVCNQCKEVLGELQQDNLYKIHKWNLELKCENNTVNDTFSPVDDVLLSLVNYARDQSGRYVLVKHGTSQVLLWLFSSDLQVILNNKRHMSNAMKILYSTDRELISRTCDGHNVDEVTVKTLPFNACLMELNQTNSYLPDIISTFGPWSVSYAELYSH